MIWSDTTDPCEEQWMIFPKDYTLTCMTVSSQLCQQHFVSPSQVCWKGRIWLLRVNMEQRNLFHLKIAPGYFITRFEVRFVYLQLFAVLFTSINLVNNGVSMLVMVSIIQYSPTISILYQAKSSRLPLIYNWTHFHWFQLPINLSATVSCTAFHAIATASEWSVVLLIFFSLEKDTFNSALIRPGDGFRNWSSTIKWANKIIRYLTRYIWRCEFEYGRGHILGLNYRSFK